jgi:predicted ATPase
LLFSDVEGSTTLLRELGAKGYADVLAEHRRIVREACTAEGGVEVDNQGDAFFFAFRSAPAAVTAAQAVTGALAAGRIQVRIGLHTGTPLVTEEGYVGDDVHLAARVGASGHGGQVVLSRTTRDLLDGRPLTDLGEHRLKDIPEAVSIFQLGSERFPPLKTISNTNLPRPASSFIGRERELRELLAAIRSARLVTLTGPGGSGKTRLALEAAATLVPSYKAGVFWIGLASLRDPLLVTETIAQTLGAKDGLAEHIGERELLLLLDNLEQVIEAAPELSALLSACANLTVLVTSRELLRIQGEVEYTVPPLASPEAVALFCERSRLEPSEEIAELCVRLDELPLAVELAAARTRLLSPKELLGRLGQRLDDLKGTRDADPRQQTLRATIAWSFDLSPIPERGLFAQLAVFAGGCTVDAAEAVCGADLDSLGSLVDKSLVRRTGDRFWMLETIRQFALERLDERGDVEALRRGHALYCLALVERAAPELWGREQRAWLERLELDHDNLRAALWWSQEAGDAELGLRLAGPLWHFWWARNHLAEGTRALEALLQLGEAAPASLRARALLGASRLAHAAGDLEGSLARAEQALAAARTSRAAREIAEATENLGVVMFLKGATDPSLALLEDSIARFRALGDHVGTANALNNLGNALLDVGDTLRAAVVLEEALALQRDAENRWGISFVLHTLGYLALHERDFEPARERLEETLLLCSELGDLGGIGTSLEGLAHAAAGRGDDRCAVVLWAAGEAIRVEAGFEMQPTEETLREAVLPRVRVRLGEAAFAAAWVEGAALAPEDAVAYALRSGTNASSNSSVEPLSSR